MNAIDVALKAHEASDAAAHLTTEAKNRVLGTLEELLHERQEFLFEENRKDIEKAGNELLPASLIERLKMDAKVVGEMAAGLRDVIELPDPVGEIVKMWTRPSGLRVGRMRIPIGVIAIIYESRPNVTVGRGPPPSASTRR